jgi:hypothetical protein
VTTGVAPGSSEGRGSPVKRRERAGSSEWEEVSAPERNWACLWALEGRAVDSFGSWSEAAVEVETERAMGRGGRVDLWRGRW